MPYFGFKAKRAVVSYQLKIYCTVPYFGFKAKREDDNRISSGNCTVPYFGFKAKRKSLRCSSSSLVISIAPMWLRSFL